jgi:hypothetical protein
MTPETAQPELVDVFGQVDQQDAAAFRPDGMLTLWRCVEIVARRQPVFAQLHILTGFATADRLGS